MNPSLTLEIKGLTISQRGGPVLVNDLNLQIRHGEALGLAGESGSGKSLTALAVMGLLDKGCFEMEGEVLWTSPRSAKTISLLNASHELLRSLRGHELAMIFQEPLTALNPVMRCGAQLEECFGLYYPDWDRDQRRKGMKEALLEVQLHETERILDAYPHEISGGQRQRLMIAMALSGNPGLLIADEPTTALDTEVQAALIALLGKLRRDRGLTLMFISHDLPLMSSLVDRWALMRKGELLEFGPVNALAKSDAFPQMAALLAARPDPDSLTYRSQPGDQNSLLKVSGLSWTLPTGRTVVDNISFDLEHGGSLGIVGASGSGKSSLARMLAGLTSPTQGQVFLNGRPLWDRGRFIVELEIRLGIQMVFQDPYSSLNPVHSIEQMLIMVLQRKFPLRSAKECRDLAHEWIAKVGLDPTKVSHRRPASFSGGQRQRLVLARSLCLNPQILICDESVAALDGTIQAQILELLLQLQQDLQFGMIFITHDLAVAGSLCHRLLVMSDGKMIEIASAQDILQRPQHMYTQRLIQSIPRVQVSQAT
ncbi:MAG: ABC transporter ATP-binding protein [Sphingomonadales bacterium]|nr:ABC transporter ATP-binding protein [Sphingomonadales bacterium]